MAAATKPSVETFAGFGGLQRKWRFTVAAILTLTIGLMFLEWVWKLPFLGGFPGPYWLFVAADAVIGPLIFLAVVATVLLFMFGLMQLAADNRPVGNRLIGLAGVCLAASLGLATTIIVIVAQHTVHMDSQRVRQHVYYLADYPLFAESNYRLFECDFVGVFCKSVYYSGDVIGSDSWPGTLDYDAASNELVIITGAATELYTYSPP